MILCRSYQNPINERHMYKIAIHYTCLSIVSRLVIFCWHVSHLLNFDTTNMITFDTKYLFKKDEGEKTKRKKMGKIWPISKGKKKMRERSTHHKPTTWSNIATKSLATTQKLLPQLGLSSRSRTRPNRSTRSSWSVEFGSFSKKTRIFGLGSRLRV